LPVKYRDNDEMQTIAGIGSEKNIDYKQPGYVCT